jgi:hypothetical protein
MSRNVVCNGNPIVLEADHNTMTRTGACRMVTLAGPHNDVALNLAPSGRFGITGAHHNA